MEEQYDLGMAICSYLDDSRADYSLLVTGEWGSGKTFYFRNKLVSSDGRLAKSKNCTVIMVSAGGTSSVNEIISGLGTALLAKLKKWENTSNPTLNIILEEDLLSCCPTKIKEIGKITQKIFHIGRKVEIKKDIDFLRDRLLFVIDDIERYKGDLSALFAVIHTRYVEHGVHVIYLANEQKIEKINEYMSCKEKYIRRTIVFQPILKDTLNEICIMRQLYVSKFVVLFQHTGEKVVEFCNFYKIKNLRIIMTAMDCYDFFLKISSLQGFNNQLSLFLNILLHVDCYAHSDDKSPKVFADYLKSKNIKTDVIGNGYSGYIDGVISFQNTIVDYISKGYASDDSVKNMIAKEFPEDNVYLNSLFSLYNYERLEKADILKNIDSVLYGISIRKLPYERLESISSLFRVLETELSETINYKEKIRAAIKDPEYHDRYNYYKQHRARDLSSLKQSNKEDIFALEIYDLLEKEQKEFDKNTMKNKFITAFSEINSKSFDVISSDFRDQVYELICKCNLVGEIKYLNNCGIYNLRLAMEQLNTDDLIENQYEYMQEIKEALKRQLKEKDHIADDYAYKKREELVYSLQCRLNRIEKTKQSLMR